MNQDNKNLLTSVVEVEGLFEHQGCKTGKLQDMSQRTNQSSTSNSCEIKTESQAGDKK